MVCVARQRPYVSWRALEASANRAKRSAPFKSELEEYTSGRAPETRRLATGD
jgi:hypothetical protein